ncbi:hypothetical protein FIBSPDRAFT_953240 [Athelia psychrophila]|uniref:Uncharacterized protein n=1 Tax=Athelia psychrophila TaxID=1759441 RepID=A0A166KH73_9AGAM|nr:hypothetical protein FIBSPDRAFT_953240 [Fibularhizoctonia sp. CBS 109695]
MLVPTDPSQTQDTPPPINANADVLHQYEQRQQLYLHSPNPPGIWPMHHLSQTPTGAQYMPYHNMSTPPQQTMMGAHYGPDYGQAGPKRPRIDEDDRYGMASGMDPGQILIQVMGKCEELTGMVQKMTLKMDEFEGTLNGHHKEITHLNETTKQSADRADRAKSEPKLQAVVHQAMYYLCDPDFTNEGTGRNIVLPAPLPAGTAARQLTVPGKDGEEDTIIRVFNPDWMKAYKDCPEQREYISQAILWVITNNPVDDPLTDIPSELLAFDVVREYAMTFLTTLKLRYRKQTDEQAAKKYKTKTMNNRRSERAKTKWENRLAAVPQLEESLQTTGLARYVVRGWMSPDASDCGEADAGEWEDARALANAGSNGRETCPVPFRATWLSKLLYALDKNVISGKPGVGKRKYDCFHGLEVNAVRTGPKHFGKEVHYRCMFDDTWMEDNVASASFTVTETPSDFNISVGDIPNSAVGTADLEALGLGP